jgi:hypothetical protein
VWVIAGGQYTKQYLEMVDRYPMLINNRSFLKTYPDARLVEGGVNTFHFRRLYPVKVGYYAGRGDIKGESQILEALSGSDFIKLVPFRDLSNTGMLQLYNAVDYFVAWEQRPGWSNTAAEAVACGTEVLTNGVNCEPFLDRCRVFESLQQVRDFLLAPMSDFAWERVAERLLEIWKEDKVCQ